MFQYAALERKNTTEPLERRRKSQVSCTGKPRSRPRQLLRRSREIQLPRGAADCSDAAGNYSTRSDAHLESGENLFIGTKAQLKLGAVYLHGGDGTRRSCD